MFSSQYLHSFPIPPDDGKNTDLNRKGLQRLKEKSNLDLMRAIAVSIVVADHLLMSKNILHLGPWATLNLGLFGVYIFFVHTCLVLMWSLERKPHTLNFYIRRAFRIYPLAIVMICAAILTHWPVGWTQDDFFHASTLGMRNVFANLALIQNVWPKATFILAVTWSLPPEVDMYVLLPVLFAFASRERSLWPIVLLWALAVGVLHGLGLGTYGNTFATVIPDFLPGVIAYVGFRTRKETLPSFLLPVMLLALCLLTASLPQKRMDWLACLLIGLALPCFRQLQSSSIVKISHQMAKYSYGIYLTHPFGIVLGVYFLRHWNIFIQVLVTLLSTGIMSVLAYHLVEEPLIRAGVLLAAKAELRYGIDSLEDRLPA